MKENRFHSIRRVVPVSVISFLPRRRSGAVQCASGVIFL